MIYLATIPIPEKRPETNPIKRILEINKGLIWRIEAEYPAGCCGLVHLQIFDGSYQLFPATPGESLRGDAVTVSYDDLYLKTAAPFELTLKAWNEDETYPHTIQVRIGMATSEAFMSRYMPSISWEKFQGTIEAAAVEQEKVKQEQLEKIKQIPGEE
ncbi:hypothetical protein ES707_06701 [subsurface metagenome]